MHLREDMDNLKRPIAEMPQIDGLRTIAVLAAIFSHYMPETCKYINYGHAGVQLFFVISGFLITGILLQGRNDFALKTVEASGSNYIRQFYIRRFLRIFPLYYGVVFALLLANRLESSLPIHLTYTSNIYMGLTGQSISASHFWSLCVEEQFYLFWPFIILFTPKKHLLRTMLSLIVFSLLFRVFSLAMGLPWQSMYLLTANLDCLSAGAILAMFWRDQHLISSIAKKTAVMGWLGLTTLVVLIILSIMFPQPAGYGFKLRYIFQNLIYAVLFSNIVYHSAIGYSGYIGKLLNLSAMKYIGRISYGLYVYHPFPFAVLTLICLELNIFKPEGWIHIFASLVITVIAASISWHFFEAPINNLKRFFPYKKSYNANPQTSEQLCFSATADSIVIPLTENEILSAVESNKES